MAKGHRTISRSSVGSGGRVAFSETSPGLTPGSSGGGSSTKIAAVAPSSPNEGEVWLESADNGTTVTGVYVAVPQ